MASCELLSVDAIEGKTARVTVAVTIGDERFIQQLGNIPLQPEKAKAVLRAYADDYEAGLAAARAAEAEEAAVRVTVPLDSLVGQTIETG
jgi:hypothetical protein